MNLLLFPVVPSIIGRRVAEKGYGSGSAVAFATPGLL